MPWSFSNYLQSDEGAELDEEFLRQKIKLFPDRGLLPLQYQYRYHYIILFHLAMWGTIFYLDKERQ